MIKEKIYLSEIIRWHEGKNGKVLNFGVDEKHPITFPRAIELGDEFNISLLTAKYREDVEYKLNQTKCKLIILPEELLGNHIKPDGKAFLLHDNPKKVLTEFCRDFLESGRQNSGRNIHPTAVIEEGAKLGRNIHVGAHVYISGNSEIGENCSIQENTVIKNSTLGNNVWIGCNNTIGENGFGYNKSEGDELVFFPHYGRVIIGDNVDIGNNTCIDRGSLSDTIIERGVKIDNLVHIAHNVVIGKNTLIIACSMIAGSVVIGENSWVAPSSSIRNAITIGKGAIIGLGSTVTKEVKDHQTVMGNPAIPIDDFLLLRKKQKEEIEKSGSDKKINPPD